ncbi:hypothetical protein J4558_20850 [Leptolyngbya sp. 15MV]|nr:hypothetical protein J4558_20850 [Leptolyngbya sp. 15MV]
MAAWINEFHYDNAGADTGEFIEIAGAAGTNLSGWSLVLYNGNPTQLVSYNTLALSGTIANQQGGFGTISFSYPANGIQNGNTAGTEPDGIALVNGTTVVQFLSYEGSFTPLNGPAAGIASTDIGLFQTGSEPAGSSLHLIGTGDEYADFAWAATTDDSPGAVNAGQSFGSGVFETVSIADASVAEGDSGETILSFTVTRTGNTGAFTVNYATADGSAVSPGDYAADGGVLTFEAGGALSQTISVTVNGDTAAEADETLTVTLSGLVNGSGTTTIADGSATGTIVNDDLVFTEIGAIQGAGHRSPLATTTTGSPTGTNNIAQSANSGTARYNVEGVVTAIAANGFFMQDATPDADAATSDGIFVFTSTICTGRRSRSGRIGNSTNPSIVPPASGSILGECSIGVKSLGKSAT